METLIKRLLLLLMLLSPTLVSAQSSNTTGRFLVGLFAARPTCSSNAFDTNAHNGDLYNDTDDGNVWKCFGGVWSAFNGGGGSGNFSALTSGTNLTANMLVGTGATLGPTGSGTVTANVFSGVLTTANIPGGTFCSAGNYTNGLAAGLVPNCIPIYYQTIQSNAVAVAQETKWNAVPPFICVDNGANTRTDCSIPVAVGVGGSHASGLVPDPGASGTASDYLGRDMTYHTSSSANTVKPDPASGIMYVASICNGGIACSDANDGLSWGTAKLTPYAALLALPGGLTSPPTSGSGTVYVSSDPINGIPFGGPVGGGLGGWWMFGATDVNYAGGKTGWMRAPANGLSVTMECAYPGVSATNNYVGACVEFWGGHTDTVHPAIWINGVAGQFKLKGFRFNFQSNAIKLGIDSNNSRGGVGDEGATSLLLEDVSATPGNCYANIGAGPSLDIGTNSFFIKIIRGTFGGCQAADYNISAISRTSNVVTVTLNHSGTNDVIADSANYILIRNVADKTFNGGYVIASTPTPTTLTFAQVGPDATSSGGQAFPYGGAAVGLNAGHGAGNGFVYMDDVSLNSGGIWVQGGFNGAGLSAKNIIYEGSGGPDMSVVEIVGPSQGGNTDIEVNDVQPADNNNPICGVENTGTQGNISVQNTSVCGAMEIFHGGQIDVNVNAGRQGQYTGGVGVVNRRFSPYAVQFPNVIGPYTSWSVTADSGFTVTPGQLAPDGTLGAVRITNISGAGRNAFIGGYSGTIPQLASTYVFGAWVKGTTNAPTAPLIFNLNSFGGGVGSYCRGNYLSGQGSPQANGAPYFTGQNVGDGEWWWVSGSCNMIAAPGGGGGFQLLMLQNTPAGSVNYIYAPVLMTIPAGVLTDNEVYALQYNLQAYPSNAVAGDIAMIPGQRFDMAVPGSNFMYFMQGSPTANRTITWPDAAGTIGLYTGSPANNDCAKFVVTGGVTTLTTAGAACGSGGGSGTVNNALLNSFAIYTANGTSNVLGGVPGPTTPANVPQYIIYNPNGSVSGAPTPALAGVPGRSNSSASDAVVVTDRNNWIQETNAGAVAVSIAQNIFTNAFAFKMQSLGAGSVVTITPSAGTCNGQSSCTMSRGQNAIFSSIDATNLIGDIHDPPLVAGTNITLVRGDYGLTINASTGTVSTTGSPANGNLAKFSAAATITNGDLSGDCTTSGTLAITCQKVNGTSYPAGGALTTNFVPVVTGVSAVTYELVPNAALANASITINGQTSTLGSTANVNAGSTAHGVAINEGNGAAIASTALGALNMVLAGKTSADPAFNDMTDVFATVYAGTASGAVNVLAACPTNAATALTTGMESSFLPNLANTTTNPTYNLCTLGAATVTRFGTGALVAGDLSTTAIAHVRYDGTRWQLQNPQTATGGSATAWSSLLNAAGALTLANAGNATTFNQTSAVNWTWANTTAATSSVLQNSPLFNFIGNYWNGAAGATDTWTEGVVESCVPACTNGTSTLTFAHIAGTTGFSTVSVPSLQLGLASAPSPVLQGYTNAAGGTTNGLIVKLNGTNDTVVNVGTSDTEAVGIMVSGAGTSGTGQVAVAGTAACTFDNTSTAGHYVQISTGTAGNCHDAGATVPESGGTILGRVADGGVAGTQNVALAIVPVAYPLLLPNGTAAAPPYSFSAHTTDGIYWDTTVSLPSFDKGNSYIGSWGASGIFTATNLSFGWLTHSTGVVSGSITQDTSVLTQFNFGGATNTDTGTLAATTYTRKPITGTNAAGSNVTLQAGNGTGNAKPALTFIDGAEISATSGTTAGTIVHRQVINDSKVLSTTSATATSFLSLNAANDSSAGGLISYSVIAKDTTGHANCISSGRVVAVAENSGGTIKTSIDNAAGVGTSVCSGSGTLTLSFTITNANPAVLSVTPSWTVIVPTNVYILFNYDDLSDASITP